MLSKFAKYIMGYEVYYSEYQSYTIIYSIV